MTIQGAEECLDGARLLCRPKSLADEGVEALE
jgi:hypothetical protein